MMGSRAPEPSQPNEPLPQVTAIVDRDELGAPCVAILVHVGPVRLRLQLDANNAGAFGRMLLALGRDAAAQLVVPNGEGKLITP